MWGVGEGRLGKWEKKGRWEGDVEGGGVKGDDKKREMGDEREMKKDLIKEKKKRDGARKIIAMRQPLNEKLQNHFLFISDIFSSAGNVFSF